METRRTNSDTIRRGFREKNVKQQRSIATRMLNG